jgi:hypothetical protein
MPRDFINDDRPVEEDDMGNYVPNKLSMLDQLMVLLYKEDWVRYPSVLLDAMSKTEAEILGFLIDQIHMHRRNKKVDEDGWFFCRMNYVERATGIQHRSQQRALKTLEKKGLISRELRGMPAKRYVRLHLAKLVRLSGELRQKRKRRP